MSDFEKAGSEVGNFLGGILNPVLGSTTETIVTQKPPASSRSNTVFVIVGVVMLVGVIGFFLFKNKKQLA